MAAASPARRVALAAACFVLGFVAVAAVRAMADGGDVADADVPATATTGPPTTATATTAPPVTTAPVPPAGRDDDERERPDRGNGNGNGNGRDDDD